MDTTTIKALKVLEALASSPEPRGVAELGRQLGFTQSNTYRILSTLASEGYVRSFPDTGRYALSLHMWELGIKALDRHMVKRVAYPHLRKLFAQVDETVLAAELDGHEVLYIDKLESESPLRVSVRLGSRAPVLRTATGLAILAYHPADSIKAQIAAAKLDKAEATRLRDVLAETRKRGYAVTINAIHHGVHSIGAPIFGPDTLPLGAVAVSGPPERMNEAKMAEIAMAVLNASATISESLGMGSPVS